MDKLDPKTPGTDVYEIVARAMREFMPGDRDQTGCPGFTHFRKHFANNPRATIDDIPTELKSAMRKRNVDVWVYPMLIGLTGVVTDEWRLRILDCLTKDGADHVVRKAARYGITDAEKSFLIGKHGPGPARLGRVAPPQRKRGA